MKQGSHMSVVKLGLFCFVFSSATKHTIKSLKSGMEREYNLAKAKRRSTYPSITQKRKLMSLVARHPQLISYKPSENFSLRDCEALWIRIAKECNASPGARKTWRQWKKTWQDIRSKHKKKLRVNGEVPDSIKELSESEREALGWKNVSSTTNYQELEFLSLNVEGSQSNFDNFNETLNEVGSHSNFDNFNQTINNDTLNANEEAASISETESLPEVKKDIKPKRRKQGARKNSDDSNCTFNCERLALQEERKISIKEDYFNFKKDYLRQKLLLMKEQVEALKDIAKNMQPKVVEPNK